MRKGLGLILAMVLMFIIAACSAGQSAPPPSSQQQPKQRVKISTWAVYWDAEGVAHEVAKMGETLGSLHYFAAYFDEQDNLFIPDNLVELRGNLKGQQEFISYLTFVNDKKLEGGGSSLKDTELLYRLLSTKESRSTHISQIISLAKGGGYDGIEIDYEAIRKDMTLWQHFIDFITELAPQAQENNLLLRVILEPNIPYDKLTFPQGAEYVIMCYNLYGPGTSPGPKADDDFLAALVEKTASLPGRRIFALANGGFDWEGSTVRSLTEQQAAALVEQHKAEVNRDKSSHALSFSYKQDGTKHTVWYADSSTIDHWINQIRDSGDFGIALWRIASEAE